MHEYGVNIQYLENIYPFENMHSQMLIAAPLYCTDSSAWG